ncbi:MAG: helix-turn-helix domain-containing protein [Lachnospiraceae bacterium]|nr:helix-turn-helix domain-containing protein [Lachnospiraceae bacterium]
MIEKLAVPKYTTAQEIKHVRKMLGMTQKDFAVLTGYSKPSIERLETADKPVTGPIVLLVKMLMENPSYVESLTIPKQEYPKRMWYMYKDKICTLIDVDDRRQKVSIKNFVVNNQFKAFGVIENPSYADYLSFIESRCFPRTRNYMKIMLESQDIPYYDPMLIIKKTNGRMAEDDFWIKFEE